MISRNFPLITDIFKLTEVNEKHRDDVASEKSLNIHLEALLNSKRMEIFLACSCRLLRLDDKLILHNWYNFSAILNCVHIKIIRRNHGCWCSFKNYIYDSARAFFHLMEITSVGWVESSMDFYWFFPTFTMSYVDVTCW